MVANSSANRPSPAVAVIGSGYWGKNIVRNMGELGALAAIVDSDAKAAEPLAQQYAVPHRSWNEVLLDRAIAGVVIALPVGLHARYAREALEAGKHVLVEKPMALNVADAETLCKVAERVDRRLMVGHLLQYHPAFVKMLELVRAGALGRIQYLYSHRLNLGKIRREEDILWSFAPHDISMILSLVGEEPIRVVAEGASYLHGEIADVTVTNLTFRNGASAHIFVCWLNPFKEQRLVVVGDNAMAVFDDALPWEDKLLVYPHQIAWRDGAPTPTRADAKRVELVQGEPLRLECQHFLDCIKTGASPRTDHHEGLRVLKVLAAATRSIRAEQAEIDAARRGDGKAPAAAAEPVGQRFTGVSVHESAYIDADVAIGSGSKIWHFSHVLPRTTIGRNVIVGQGVAIGPDVAVGDGCKIQNNVSIYKGVVLEDGVFCGPACTFTNVLYPRAEVERKDEFRRTLVKRGATIGANATVIAGVTLGEYCTIGAGAVVTRDVPAFGLVVGNPARRIGWVSHAGERLGADLVCRRTGRRYREIGSDRIEEIS